MKPTVLVCSHAANKDIREAERGGSRLQSQYFGRLRQADHLRSGVRDQPGQRGETASTKSTKISQTWWQVPVIPATQEAEAGELLKDGGCSELRSCYYTPAWVTRARLRPHSTKKRHN
uniref:Uncharacterized protein n=2 Tax=Macaca TaxID=9539 RepID=A0A5F8AJM0_MACMU